MTNTYDDGYEEAVDDGHNLVDEFLAPKGETFEMNPDPDKAERDFAERDFLVEGEDIPKPGTVLAPGVVVAEDFGNDCCVCGTRISSGQVIHKVKGSSWRHEYCSGQPLWERDPKTNPTAAEWLYRHGRQS